MNPAPASPAAACVVFLGPTLPWREAAAVLPAHYLPPARQGDVYRAVRQHAPRAIGIVDGVFLDVAAVWHREILWALSQGVHVFGAASMGALRAAELGPYGMRGIGRIADAYRAGTWPGYAEPFEDDDEVAVIHAPAEVGAVALSDAMVDVRDTLLAAEAAGVIGPAERDALASAVKRLHFADRRLADMHALGAPQALCDWLPGHIVRRKRLDALAMLDVMAQWLAADPPPFQPAFRFERALVWEQFVAAAETPDDTEALVLAELRLDPAAWQDVRRAALGRMHIGRPAGAEMERRQIELFRQRRRLWRRQDLDRWLHENALDAARAEALLRREAALATAAADSGEAIHAAMLDHLRIGGQFAALLRCATAKHQALADAAPPPGEPYRTAVLEWYFEQRLGTQRPQSLAGFIAETGWADETDFLLAVWREYLFTREAK